MKTYSVRRLLVLLLTAWFLSFSARAGEDSLSLAGQWRFQLDRADAGVSERWFERVLDQRIQLPGALQNQGFGDDITIDTKWTGDVGADRWLRGAQYEKYRQPGNIKVPFFLQPEKHYVGAAWYQREIEIPAAWAGQRVVLTLERTHWETSLWVDHRFVGTNDSLSTPHLYDLGSSLTPGRHTITLRVDNRVHVDVGSWSHSVSDHTQGNWNGVIGRIELTATPPVWVEDLQVFPDLASKSVLVKGRLGNTTGQPRRGRLELVHESAIGAASERVALDVSWDTTGGVFASNLKLGDNAAAWDEFTPRLYRLEATLDKRHSKTVTFGLREISTTPDKLIAINGRKTFLRGTLECCIFPLTGYPPADVESWKRVIRICKAHGLNHIRFHSFCPPEAAFTAADELGFYYHVECAAWTTVGSGLPQDQWLYREGERILRAYGNHPSFVMMAYGNEPNGPKHQEWLAGWVNHWKQADPRRIYTSGAGWPHIPENQYHVAHEGRGPGGWLGRDYRNAIAKLNAPVIVHEMGQWCVYPNFDEISKYTGPLKPKNFDIFRDSLTEHGMLHQWRDFLRASGKLQALCYKEEIEAAMRTPGVSGVQLLDLHDFPGQGTALVGVLDPFWDSKGYITPEQFRRFYNSTVPLARLLKRVWTPGETLTAEVELAHFGPAPLPRATPYWKLTDAAGRAVAGQDWPAKDIPVDRGIELGRVSAALAGLAAPGRYSLAVGLKGTPFENDWNIWLVPGDTSASPPQDVLFTSTLDEAALARLNAGGKVLFAGTKLSPAHPKLGFEPIFWNRYMFNTQGRQTLGLLCDPAHPALAQFPTDFWQDWLWNDIVTQARGVILDEFPAALVPIVQVIDDWNTNRKLGLVFECRVGQGKLLVCAADLSNDLEKRPAARQLRSSLLAYVAGPMFAPRVEMSAGELQRLLHRAARSTLVNLGAKVLKVDSEDRANGNVAANVFDGDPDTIWHTRWQPANDPMPHELVIDLGREVALKGITYLPRQDMVNGRIADAEIFCGNNPQSWGAPLATPKWPNVMELQTVRFNQTIKARYLRLLAKSEVNANPFAAIAELDVLLDPQ